MKPLAARFVSWTLANEGSLPLINSLLSCITKGHKINLIERDKRVAAAYVLFFLEEIISVMRITCSDAKAALLNTEIFPFGWLVLFKTESLCAP